MYQQRFPQWLSYGRFWLLLVGLTCLSACAASDAQSVKAGKGGEKRPVPVVMAAVTQKTVPVLVQATGTVQAYSTIAVTSQISGQLTAVYFKEGQEVQQGDRLFTIDPRPLQTSVDQAFADRAKAVAQVKQAEAALAQAKAQVNQAKATVAKDVAQANNASVQAQRYSGLLNQGAVSREQADQFRTSAAAQDATVAADQSNVGNAIAAVAAARANLQSAQAAVNGTDATIDNAKVQLSYSTINAPINGRTGSLKINQGNLVKANDTNPLVVISQIRPIYVTFSVPQRQLPAIKQYQARGQLEVDVLPVKDTGKPVRGTLVFVDSSVDPTTGTIQLKASFPNAEGRLTPGQFVNVMLKLTTETNAIVVPSQAIQTGQKGEFVYVVKADKTVEMRSIVTGPSVNNQVVIKQGLQSGETVVTDGQFNLVPGATVQAKQAGEPGNKGTEATK
ncbi:MAG: efflux RND transporter periplasmic adaptor subunit [Stenomitos rutilans HA7619-LM2]|jgi:multidrug efflux system membrane fusion protein|nr:efflux RND transporter periplasmic adaptor subunit [Stenomitos rutilans HA7619-LM2]